MIERFKKPYFCIFKERIMNRFDDIRSYRDDEIPAAMQRIAQDATIPSILNYFDLGMSAEEFGQWLRSIKTVDAFQFSVVKTMVEKIIEKTTDGLESSGWENLNPKGHYLFVSNHRDIVLDAMFMDYALCVHGFKLFNIAFGSNLVFNGLANDFAKANKMFQMKRGGNRIEFYNHLAHTSDYIRHLLVEKRESVWIAQRNGRTKDGIDATDPALVKMFGMSSGGNRVASLAELNILPVSVSYEWESCDQLKALELYQTRKNGHYEKQPNEDLNSILTGVKQWKGRVHIHFGQPVLESELGAINDCASGEFYRRVAKLMDQRINANVRLYPNNYIAHDLRSGTTTFAEHYTSEQKADFEKHLLWMENYPDLERKSLEDIFLGIYANPVDSLLKVLKPSQG